MKKVYVIVGVILMLLVWLIAFVPQLKMIPEDFLLDSEVISLDNFYDSDAGAFTGDQKSESDLVYKVVDIVDGIYVVDNTFEVTSVEGEKIFSVKRQLGVDPKTGQHVKGYGDKDRDGYLFAPRNLNKDAEFIYWHPNYDAPANMKFVSEENLFGLNVYHYRTEYKDVDIDQTESLHGLPGVPEIKGIKVEPVLDLWVEPTTGMIAKYADDTTAYYYDILSGEKLDVWNQFSNQTTRASIIKNVELIKKQKSRLIMIDYGVPAIFLILIAGYFLVSLNKKIAMIFVLLSFGVFVVVFVNKLTNFEHGDGFKIGVIGWGVNEEYDLNVVGFKQALAASGYNDIRYFEGNSATDVNKHKEILNSFKAEDVDLIYSLTTPGTILAKEIFTETPIVFSIVTYPVESGLISSLDNSGNNLVGTRNWIDSEKQLESFLTLVPDVSKLAFLHREGEPNSSIQFEEMKLEAEILGLELIDFASKNVEELKVKLESMDSDIDGLYSACDTLIQGGGGEDLIIEYGKINKLPSFTCNRSGVEKGDLIGTVADFYQLGRLSGEKAAEILNGASPESLKTKTVARPFIYINDSRADLLNVKIPQQLYSKIKEIY